VDVGVLLLVQCYFSWYRYPSASDLILSLPPRLTLETREL
jgi:hypothetical protein